LLELLQHRPGLNTGAILEHWRGREEARHLNKLAHWKPLAENLDLAAELHGLLEQIAQQATARRIGQLLDNEHQRPLDDDEKQELKNLLLARGPGP
jgi:DNA primase